MADSSPTDPRKRTDDRDPIDPFSDRSLYDVLDPAVEWDPETDTFDYYGFHLNPQGDGRFVVQLDGHAEMVDEFHRDEYDDVLELVADLNDLLIYANDLEYRDDRDELVEWAGKIITGDQEKATENPEHYLFIPRP